MSNDNGFVERPATHREISVSAKLRATAENGKAILIEAKLRGGHTSTLSRQGYRLHSTTAGAPEGMAFVWTSKKIAAKENG